MFLSRRFSVGITGTLRCFIAAVLVPFFFSLGIAAEPSHQQKAPADAASQFLGNALALERTNTSGMEQEFVRWEALKSKVLDELEAYRAQNTANANVLLVLQARTEDLKNALNTNRLATKALAERIGEIEKISATISERNAQFADRIAIAEKQLAELQQGRLNGSDTVEVRRKIDNLLGILRDKQRSGESLAQDYAGLLEKMERMLADLTQVRGQLEKHLRLRFRSDLFERSLQPFARLTTPNLQRELTGIRDQTSDLIQKDFWRQQWIDLRQSASVTQTLFLVLFLSAILLRGKVRRYLYSFEQRMEAPNWRTRRTALAMLRRSFLLICAASLLLLYDLLKLPHVNFSVGRFLNQLLVVLLFARWGIDFLRHRFEGVATGTGALVKKRLIRFLHLFRVVTICHLLLTGLFGNQSLIVWLVRLVLESGLVVWTIFFWRRVQQQRLRTVPPEERTAAGTRLFLAQSGSYIIAGGALLMELAGYDAMAGHWLVAWAKTALVALWASLAWASIAEWYAGQQNGPRSETVLPATNVASPIGWFLVQMTRLGWLAAVLAGSLMVWSSSSFTATVIKEVFNFHFSVGSLNVSVKGLLMAVVVLCLTHMATRMGRRILAEKVLDEGRFERGLKDSIVTISSYFVWGLGILLALGFLGVNTTSLAVVFGALSIGIGFGLQNIFNNFISGLILLFERPIQVGDYVEVGGLWAEVKEINVRSTIVQTFDNATVIIPNSEFISQQVTNWSFKDPRMRRHVDIGVAYGSDTERVRTTLLEIAARVPEILKTPPPDVIFLDHGDSALLFRLRFWVHVDNYYRSSTAVRFALDHRLRELGIEIAFPQRDIHVRSVHSSPMWAEAQSKAPLDASHSDSSPGPGDERE